MRSVVASSCMLLLLGATRVRAAQPAVVDDEDAEATHSYLRRKPTCVSEWRPKSKDSKKSGIPQRMHQIWWQGEDEPIPAHFLPLRQTWTANHPTWTFKTWDEKSIVQLIESKYEWFAPTFHALPSKIQQADAARYVILHNEGGVYADLDVECFQPLDELFASFSSRSVLQLFEEPATHWDHHNTVISNGLMASPKGHPLLKRILESIRPVKEVFSSGGSHKLQKELAKCDREEAAGQTSPCGCFITHSSARFFPLHESMRQPREFRRVGEHADAVRTFIDDLVAGKWPVKGASVYTAQYWTHSWIDPDIGALWLDGMAAAREKRVANAENLMLAYMWSKWGHKYKYRNHPEPSDPERAVTAYKRALQYHPDYPFAHYELGNVALEAAMTGTSEPGSAEATAKLVEAEQHFLAAVERRNNSLLFVNNLGVTRLNQGKASEAIPNFEAVLALHETAFATVDGLDVEAGARVNLGISYKRMGKDDEAYAQWLLALERGSQAYAMQALQHLVHSGGQDSLPDAARLELWLGEASMRSGKTRDAAMRFAAAHQEAHKLPDTDARGSIQARVKEQMQALSEVWDEGDGAAVPRSAPPTKVIKGGADGAEPKIEIIEATASGATHKREMPPEMREAMGRMTGEKKKKQKASK